MGAGLLFSAVRGPRRHPSGSKLRPRRGRASTRRKVQSGSGLFDLSLRSGHNSRPRRAAVAARAPTRHDSDGADHRWICPFMAVKRSWRLRA